MQLIAMLMRNLQQIATCVIIALLALQPLVSTSGSDTFPFCKIIGTAFIYRQSSGTVLEQKLVVKSNTETYQPELPPNKNVFEFSVKVYINKAASFHSQGFNY